METDKKDIKRKFLSNIQSESIIKSEKVWFVSGNYPWNLSESIPALPCLSSIEMYYYYYYWVNWCCILRVQILTINYYYFCFYIQALQNVLRSMDSTFSFGIQMRVLCCLSGSRPRDCPLSFGLLYYMNISICTSIYCRKRRT